jgi:hypothetical protein
MDTGQARRLTAAWASGITASSWPWPVPDTGRAIDSAREAMYHQLVEYVPDDADAAAAVWHGTQPRVVALAGDAVLIAGVELEKVERQSFPAARGELRCVPLDPRTATITVHSTYRTSGGWTSRTSQWQFTLAGEKEPLELTAELAEEGEMTADERLARAIAARLGWTPPAERRFAAA